MGRARRAGMRAGWLGLLILGLAALSGCRTYHYVVRAEGAPLYADLERSLVVDRMDRLDDGEIGVFEPDGDPVEIEYRGRTGYANRSDLRIFSYSEYSEDPPRAIFEQRREVILEGKDWPVEVEGAIREDRILPKMTREQVELSWGPATTIRSEGDGDIEVWTYERTHYDVHQHVRYHYYPRVHYGFGYGYGYGRRCGRGFGYHGFGYEFGWQPYYETVVYARPERRHVRFDEDGRVIGWETSSR